MSSRAKIVAPDVPTLEKRREAIDSGHPRMIGDFLTNLNELISAFGGSAWEEIYVKDVNVAELLRLMDACGEWESPVVGKFWDWLVESTDDKYFRAYDINIQIVLHEYFGIDPDDEERELRELLATQRASNELHRSRKDLGLDE